MKGAFEWGQPSPCCHAEAKPVQSLLATTRLIRFLAAEAVACQMSVVVVVLLSFCCHFSCRVSVMCFGAVISSSFCFSLFVICFGAVISLSLVCCMCLAVICASVDLSGPCQVSSIRCVRCSFCSLLTSWAVQQAVDKLITSLRWQPHPIENRTMGGIDAKATFLSRPVRG